MHSAREVVSAKVGSMDLAGNRWFSYQPPVSRPVIASWQRALDREFPRGPRYVRILLEWEAGDPWQPVGRFMLWQAFNPAHLRIEPWVLQALQGPAPRATGHYCGAGYCFCALKRNRWHDGTTKQIDMHQWRIFHETGLYATRWWCVQGIHGGHRYKWEQSEPAALISAMKEKASQPPEVGSLVYAPVDGRVLRAIRREHNIARAARRLESLQKRKQALDAEERAQALETQQLLWDWCGQQIEEMWDEGLDLLPRMFESEYGRAPVGHKVTTDYEAIEERALTAVG
jgi:hypothetical protein